MKKDKHDRILEKRERQKMKALEKTATDMLKADEYAQKIKGYKLKNNPLDYF